MDESSEFFEEAAGRFECDQVAILREDEGWSVQSPREIINNNDK